MMSSVGDDYRSIWAKQTNESGGCGMQTVALTDWENALQHVIDDMGGRPLNIHALLANHPALLEAWWPLRMYLVNGGDLEQRHCELVILRIAARMHSWYEWAAHVVRGLDSGLSLGEIENVRDLEATWGDADAALLAAVDELLARDAISPATLERLTPHFTRRQMLDIVHLKGMYTTIAAIINTWGLDLDDHLVELLPDSVTEETF
jgi:alkylhydroperoxidase family enzyme